VADVIRVRSVNPRPRLSRRPGPGLSPLERAPRPIMSILRRIGTQHECGGRRIPFRRTNPRFDERPGIPRFAFGLWLIAWFAARPTQGVSGDHSPVSERHAFRSATRRSPVPFEGGSTNGTSPRRVHERHATNAWGYIPALDGVRARSAGRRRLVNHGDWACVAAASLGVEVFFVLNGYLITSLLLDAWRGTAATPSSSGGLPARGSPACSRLASS